MQARLPFLRLALIINTIEAYNTLQEYMHFGMLRWVFGGFKQRLKQI